MAQFTELWVVLRWMAETVHTGDYLNEWYYLLAQLDSVEQLLTAVGKQLALIFPM